MADQSKPVPAADQPKPVPPRPAPEFLKPAPEPPKAAVAPDHAEVARLKAELLRVPISAWALASKNADDARKSGSPHLADTYVQVAAELAREGYAPDHTGQPGPSTKAYYHQSVTGATPPTPPHVVVASARASLSPTFSDSPCTPGVEPSSLPGGGT